MGAPSGAPIFLGAHLCFSGIYKKAPRKTLGALAAGEGFEPSQTESESVVLPLHKPAKFKRIDYYTRFFEFVNTFFSILCRSIYNMFIVIRPGFDYNVICSTMTEREYTMKRLLSAALAAALIFSASGSALAAERSSAAADTLYTLDLVSGSGSGYELDRVPTRMEALVFTLRLAGLEDEALEYDGQSTFTDVPAWGAQYTAYAQANGLVNGVSDAVFGADDSINSRDFLTMLLRVLGYSEDEGDFTWATADLTAVRLGIAESVYTEFDRGDMFDCALAALSCRMSGQDVTLIDSLIASGDVDRAKASALGLTGLRPLSAVEVAERYSSAVALLQCYANSVQLLNKTPNSTSSGFFISDDGILVTNYHTIDDAIYCSVTLESGEQYSVERVLYYDPDIDISVLKVSRTPIGGGDEAVFPYLELMSADGARVGDVVYALGNPLGLQSSISSGIISNNHRVSDSFALPMIQNTASISEGSSGGALMNEYGYVIGITTGYFTYGKDMYLAVPSDAVLSADLDGDGITLSELAEMDIAAGNEK